MAVEDSSDLLGLSSSADSFSLRLREALDASSRSIEADEAFRLDEAIAPVISLLLSLVARCTTGSEETIADVQFSEDALDEIYRFVSSSYSNPMAVEALSLELPKLLVSFAPLSDKCEELSGRIIERLVTICSPREMLSVLCEALASETNDSKELGYRGHVLFGLAKVLLRIWRRHFEQIKVVLPIVLGVLDVSSSGITEEDRDSVNDLFSAAISIGSSIREISLDMEGKLKEVLRAVLALYILQNIALVSRINQRHVIQFSSFLVAKLLEFLPFCGLSYSGLLTGSDFGVNNKICREADDEFTDCFSRAAEGACLAVIWGLITGNVSNATEEKLEVVFGDIQHDRSKIWQAVGTFKHVLTSIEYPWIIKSYGIDLLLNVMDGNFSEDYNGLDEDFSSLMPNLFASLKALEMIMIGAPESSLRKKAYRALRMVVSDIPCPQRFDILKALISKSNSPSMIAILIDLVKEEILVDNTIQSSRKEQKRKGISPFYSSNALDVVEMILRPSKGGPPPLPEHSEPVLSALNLYRFLFIIEMTGKTNHSGVLSEGLLCRAHSEWLMPLRTLISGIQAENERDGSEVAESISCALASVQLVLYRCIELVEETLQPHPTPAFTSVP
ncbi:hypothetical protein HPP92_020077 [Vanilla planifolia]|uniref:Aberrant root formation protein 4 n=1 Tax=Vanilla planifolia TaxID=51239 RepID=A0A835Q3H4_VANPL|nr:hypothetical protein HPP92_020077 [Vanilla planifolia]